MTTLTEDTMRLSAFLLTLVATTGCRDSTAPHDWSPVIGFWTSASRNTDGSTYRTELLLGDNLTFVRTWNSLSPTTPGNAGTLLAYVRTEGSYFVRGDSVFLRSTLVRSWDRDFNGGAVIVTPVTGSPYGEAGARFEIRNDSLVLHYLSYPADAPVETTEALARTFVLNVSRR